MNKLIRKTTLALSASLVILATSAPVTAQETISFDIFDSLKYRCWAWDPQCNEH